MRKFYDEFIQQKPKDMAKTMEDISFKYMNPETQQPTKIPAAHFEKELGQLVEKTVSQSVNRQFLAIMVGQLNLLKKDNEQLFYQALICMDNNLNPKDLRITDQIALNHTYDFIQEKQRQEKKDFHFFNQDITEEYDRAKRDSNIQAEAMELSNFLENQETRELNRINEQPCKQENNIHSIEDNQEDIDMDYEY